MKRHTTHGKQPLRTLHSAVSKPLTGMASARGTALRLPGVTMRALPSGRGTASLPPVADEACSTWSASPGAWLHKERPCLIASPHSGEQSRQWRLEASHQFGRRRLPVRMCTCSPAEALPAAMPPGGALAGNSRVGVPQHRQARGSCRPQKQRGLEPGRRHCRIRTHPDQGREQGGGHTQTLCGPSWGTPWCCSHPEEAPPHGLPLGAWHWMRRRKAVSRSMVLPFASPAPLTQIWRPASSAPLLSA